MFTLKEHKAFDKKSFRVNNKANIQLLNRGDSNSVFRLLTAAISLSAVHMADMFRIWKGKTSPSTSDKYLIFIFSDIMKNEVILHKYNRSL